MRITGSGKAHDLSLRASHFLKEHSTEGILLSAVGSHVTKAVTVAELLKRKLPGLEQTTTVKYVRVVDVWEPEMEGLDSMKVTRKIPSITLHLVESTDRPGELTEVKATVNSKPSTDRTKQRKRLKSSGDQDKSLLNSGHTESSCPVKIEQ